MAAASKGLVVGLAIVASLGGLLFGYDTAVISGAVAAIDHNFIAPQHLSEAASDSLSGWAISCALLGCVIGASAGGWLSTRFGRKGALLIASVLFFLGSLGSAWPEFGFGGIGAIGPAALTPFILYRILGGIGVGLASMISPLYIAEIAPPDERGRLVTLQQIAIVTGILLVYFVNYFIASQGTDAWLLSTGWRYMLASEAIPAALFFVLMLMAPDTPRWFVLKGQNDKALSILRRITDETTAQATLAEIKETLVVQTRPLLSFGGLVLFVGIMLSIFQQLVGINAVLYYAPTIFKSMGASTDTSFLQTVIVGVANMAFTLVALVTVDRWGRKPLLITGGVIMAVAMFALGALFYNAPHASGGALDVTPAASRWALVAIVGYIAGFSLSWGPVVWVLLSEIFPNSIKSTAMAIAVAAQWIANLFVSWSFKVLDGSTMLNATFNHAFAYWVYGVMSVLAALFVLRFVPETKQRNLESIQNIWAKSPAA
jgi:SP family xylose:H+ symportor-like MFS transporter